MKLLSNLFFTDVDFCKTKVIQGLDLNLNLHLSVLLRGAQVSNNILILSKYTLVELLAFSSSISNKSSQSTEKQSRIKFSRSNLDQSLSQILMYCLRYCQKYQKLLKIEADEQKWWQSNYQVLCLDQQHWKIYYLKSIRVTSYSGWL